MGKLILFLFLVHVQFMTLGQGTPTFSIEILDNEAHRFLDENTEIEVVGSQFTWAEGPLWIEDGKFLLFSDIPNNKVFKLSSEGEITEYLYPSGFMGKDFKGEEPGSNGLLLSPQGKLILMQHGERRIAMMKSTLDNPKPEYEVLVDHYQGKRLNSPNDGTYDDKGNLYFTDPPYGLPLNMDDPQKELDFQGVYCLKPSGELVLLDKLSRPNGIAFSPDYSKLYIAVSNPQHAVWYEYDVMSEEKITNKKIFYNATALVGKEGEQGLPDGMKMHSAGYLFATGPGGLWIFNHNGKPIARIHTGEKTSNCAFTPDEKTLFLTADDYVLKLSLK